jgi:hypothetical protein
MADDDEPSLIIKITNEAASNMRKRNQGQDVETIANAIQRVGVGIDRLWQNREGLNKVTNAIKAAAKEINNGKKR